MTIIFVNFRPLSCETWKIVSIPPIYVIFVSVSTISFNKKRKKKKTIQKNTNIIEQTRIFSSIIYECKYIFLTFFQSEKWTAEC